MGDIYEKIQEILGDETDEFLKNEKYYKLITEIYAMGAKYGADDILKVIKADYCKLLSRRFKGGKK
jgi:hypothetical protein